MPYYFSPQSSPLASLKSLKKILKIEDLDLLIRTKNKYYNSFKCNKSGRLLYSVKEPLNIIQKNLRSYFFKPLQYPSYLLGGIPNKDYLSNCEIHKNKKIILSEDIKNFYPSIKIARVRDIFQYFFHSPPEIASILAEICCVNGEVVTGSVISTDIANVVFFEREPILVKELANMGVTYTRYIDDITVSADRELSKDDITKIKEKIYAMLRSHGFAINRKKSKIMRQSGRMAVHGVLVNHQKLGVLSEQKNNLRAALYSFRSEVEQQEVDIEHFVGKFRSIKGRIQSLERLGYQGDKAREELIAILRLVEEKPIKRYIRSLRKVKNPKSYQRVLGKVLVFKDYSSSIAKIIRFEQRDARRRIFK